MKKLIGLAMAITIATPVLAAEYFTKRLYNATPSIVTFSITTKTGDKIDQTVLPRQGNYPTVREVSWLKRYGPVKQVAIRATDPYLEQSTGEQWIIGHKELKLCSDGQLLNSSQIKCTDELELKRPMAEVEVEPKTEAPAAIPTA